LKSEREWLRTVGILVVAFFCLSVGLHLAQTAVVPFVLAALISVTAAPLIDWQTRKGHVPHALAVVTTLALVLSVVAIVTALVVYAAGEAARTAKKQWNPAVEQLTAIALDWGIIDPDVDDASGAQDAADTTGPPETQREQPRDGIDKGTDNDVAEDAATEITGVDPGKFFENSVTLVGDYIKQAGGQLVISNTDVGFKLVTQSVLTAIFVGFLLAGYRPSLAPSAGLQHEIVSRVRRYVSTKFFVSGLTGFLVWAVMTPFGFRYAPLFGVLAFVLNFIPSLGSIICTFLPLPLAIAEYDSWGPIIAVVALPGAVQIVIGNVLEPKIMGDGLDLHPATILLSLAFWGILWGPVGMLLAAPLAASARIILGRIDTTRPIAELMAGRFSERLIPH
ncbi:MAG: AI-2E family transporter, partial [Planctomycetota bacterium]